MRPHDRDCESIRAQIDPWIDGDLSAREAEIVAGHVEWCAGCAGDVRRATQLASELRSLSSHTAPAWISAAAVSRARMEDVGSRRRGHTHRRGAGSLRAAMAVMLVVVVAAGAFVLALRDYGGNGRQTANVSQAEVEEAARELQVAFAYLGRYSRRTGNIVRKDVINDRVIPAIGRAVDDGETEVNRVIREGLVPRIRRSLFDVIPIETNDRGQRSNPGKEPQ